MLTTDIVTTPRRRRRRPNRSDIVTTPQIRRRGPDHFSGLPIDIHLLFLEAIINENTCVDADGRSPCRHEVYALISASPAIFRVFQAYRPRILRHIHQSQSYVLRELINRDPNNWALKRVQRAALVVASIPTYPEKTTMAFSGTRHLLTRFFTSNHFEDPIRHQETGNFNPPKDIGTLARLIRVVSRIRFSVEFTSDTRNYAFCVGYVEDHGIIPLIKYQLYERICRLLPQSGPSQTMSTDERFVWAFRSITSYFALGHLMRGEAHPDWPRENLDMLYYAREDEKRWGSAGFNAFTANSRLFHHF